jgi:hypothetical protein
MHVTRRSIALIPAALVIAGLLNGCATFRGSKRIEVGPFAENTTGMVSELQKFNRPVVWTYLKKYQDLPTIVMARQSVYPIRGLLRGVGLYSAQVVALYGSPLPEDKKISELARYMEEIIRPGLKEDDESGDVISRTELDAVIRDVRSSKTLLEALRKAEPMVGATVSRGNLLFDRTDSLIQVATADVQERIETEFAPLKTRIKELDGMHLASAWSYTQLLRYRSGDASALDSLRASDPAVMELLPAGRKLTSKDLDAAEHFVVDRSTSIKSMRDQLDPQFDIYKANQAELEALRNQTDERARLGRIALQLWGRSHRNLAAGISVPPMIDVVGLMKSTATTGVKSLVP